MKRYDEDCYLHLHLCITYLLYEVKLPKVRRWLISSRQDDSIRLYMHRIEVVGLLYNHVSPPFHHHPPPSSFCSLDEVGTKEKKDVYDCVDPCWKIDVTASIKKKKGSKNSETGAKRGEGVLRRETIDLFSFGHLAHFCLLGSNFEWCNVFSR